MAVRIYLDTGVYNRPFDDQGQARIWLETLAFSVILQMLEDEHAALISSTVIDYENNRNSDDVRRGWVKRLTNSAAQIAAGE